MKKQPTKPRKPRSYVLAEGYIVPEALASFMSVEKIKGDDIDILGYLDDHMAPVRCPKPIHGKHGQLIFVPSGTMGRK